jgi:hypothetical protein
MGLLDIRCLLEYKCSPVTAVFLLVVILLWQEPGEVSSGRSVNGSSCFFTHTALAAVDDS